MMSFESPLHLDFVAIARSDKIGTHQKKDDVRLVELLVDNVIEFVTGPDAPVVPWLDKPLVLERRQMFLQHVTVFLVGMGVGEKEFFHAPSTGHSANFAIGVS